MRALSFRCLGLLPLPAMAACRGSAPPNAASAPPATSSPPTAGAARALSDDDLARRTIERRAVEAVIWGMPAVNYALMLPDGVRARGAVNQIIYWSRLPDWKRA